MLQEKYLKERIKVDNKAGNLGETVKVTTEKSKIVVQVGIFTSLPQIAMRRGMDLRVWACACCRLALTRMLHAFHYDCNCFLG